MAVYALTYKTSASKALAKVPAKTRDRIIEAIEGLAEDPRPGGATKLVGHDTVWRIRVGQYRVIYDIQDDKLIVLILRVGHRKDVYREM